MIREHDRVVLCTDLSEKGLEVGDVGTVVHIYDAGKGFEVEFVALDGQTAAIATLKAEQVRSVHKGEITHARELATAS